MMRLLYPFRQISIIYFNIHIYFVVYIIYKVKEDIGPHVILACAQHVIETPASGVSLFTRISGANSTVVGNYYGKIIIPSGGSFIVFLYSPGVQPINADVAFGWWEE